MYLTSPRYQTLPILLQNHDSAIMFIAKESVFQNYVFIINNFILHYSQTEITRNYDYIWAIVVPITRTQNDYTDSQYYFNNSLTSDCFSFYTTLYAYLFILLELYIVLTY